MPQNNSYAPFRHLKPGSRILMAFSGGVDSAVAAVLACDPSGASARITAACDEKGVRFAKPDKGDWSPRAKSPLRDAGVLCDWMAGARDFLGKRPRDFGGGPDVGCFEHYGDPPTILVLR